MYRYIRNKISAGKMNLEKVKILIATIKSWNLRNAHKLRNLYSSVWEIEIIENKDKLKFELLKDLNPDYVFFPHWSWTVPREIYENYECIGFHIGDLPYGKGGSPLQNHIIRKIYRTKITAFRITGELDSGDIYIKEDFCLEVGSAEELFIKASEVIFFRMIPYIIREKPTPTKQEGYSTFFPRRKPEDSNLLTANINSIEDFYDFVRMLDAEGYPKAYIKIGNLKILFSEATLRSGRVVGRFEVEEDDGKSSFDFRPS